MVVSGQLTEMDRKIVSWIGDAGAILDIGCRDGRLTLYLARQTGRKITGIDLSSAGFRKARTMAGEARVKHLVRCLKGDVRHLDFPDNHFDAAILCYTLHHIEDPPAALEELRRVLREGGLMVVTEYEVKEGTERGDCYRFTVAELTEMVSQAGFEQVCLERAESDLLLVARNMKTRANIDKKDVLKVLGHIYDPDYQDRSVVDMGLVTEDDITVEGGTLQVAYGLTAPMCPFSAAIGLMMKHALEKALGIPVTVNLKAAHRQSGVVAELLQDQQRSAELLLKLKEYGILEKCVRL